MAFKLSAEGLKFVEKELQRYEDRMSAVIPCLYRVQQENGWVSQDSVEHLSKIMDIPEARVWEVANFYTMLNKKPVGKNHVQVCCNISCSMAESRELTDYILGKLHVKEGEVTKDGRFTVSRVECLGSCDTAPMMQINDDYYENLTKEKVDKILSGLK